MLDFIFTVLMVAVFSNLLVFAIRMSWGILRLIVGIILLPIAIFWFFVKGMVKLAFPILIIIGLVTIIKELTNKNKDPQ